MQGELKRVGQAMRRRFIALAPEDSLAEAERLMRMARVRYLPVCAGGVLVGGLSHRALLASALAADGERASARWLRETPVARVMERAPAHVTPEAPLADAAGLLVEVDGGCLPVLDPGAGEPRLVGVVTESDLLRAAFDPRPR